MTLIIAFIEFNYLSFKSKHSFLNEFFDDLDKSNNLNPQNVMASELYNTFLGICYHKYYELSDDKRKNIESKYDPKHLFLDGYYYSVVRK